MRERGGERGGWIDNSRGHPSFIQLWFLLGIHIHSWQLEAAITPSLEHKALLFTGATVLYFNHLYQLNKKSDPSSSRHT